MSPRGRTENLILELAARPVPRPLSAGLTVGGMLAMLGLALGIFVSWFGFRADLHEAWRAVPVLAKSLLPLLLFITSIALALASLRPGARLVTWPLAVPLGLGLVLVAARVPGSDSLLAEALGQTALTCVTSISLLSLVPLAAALKLMHRGAPTRPVLTGALTGLAAGAGIAAGYALHCTEDSPLFFVLWYGLGIGTAACFGAFFGHRMLRW